MTFVWEQRKLGDCTFLSGKKNKNNLNLEPYAITNEHGFIPQNKAHDEFGYMKDTDRRAYNIVSKNSFAYNPARINIGSIGYYKGTENVIISSLYEVFQTVDSVYDPFLWQWFKTKDFQNWIIRLQEGSVRLYFYYDKLCECIIRMPKLEEQIKIANYFEALDNLITLHQRKILLDKYFLTIDWEQRKLGKIFVSMQNNTLSRADLSYDSGVAMNVHYGDILVKFGEVLDIKSERLPIIVDETVLDKYKSSFLKNGDIIIADTAEDETVGKCTEIAGLSDEYVISGLHTIPYRPLQKFAFGYLGYYMNSTSYHNQLLPLMQGIKVTSISKVSLQNTVIIYPKSKVEQAAIGKYFYNLDNLITLHQWKCMISRKNIVYAWEQRKLGEIGSASSGVGFPNSEQGGKEGIPFYKVSDMNLEGNEIEMTVSNNYVTKEQIARKKWSPLNDVPAMYFAKVGAAVMLNRKRLCRFPFLFDNNTMAYSLNKEYWDINFAKAEFAKIDLTKLVQVGALPSYNANDVESIKIMIPSLFEQSKIGNYFDELDRLITLHQWECIVCTKIKVNTSIQCKFIKIGVKLQKCILLSIILLFKRRKISCIFYVNILLRFIKVIELEIELIFGIIDGTIIVIFYLKIRCLYLNIFCTFIFKFNK